MKSADLIEGHEYSCRLNFWTPRTRWTRVTLIRKNVPGGVGNEPYHEVLELDDATGTPKTYLDGTPRKYYVLPRDLVSTWEDQVSWWFAEKGVVQRPGEDHA